MTTHGLCRAVGVFHLRLHARRAEIKFGPDAGGAEGGDHALVVGDAVAVHDEHHDRAGLPRLTMGLADIFSAASRRETPMENPVAGTGSPRKRPTSPS